MNFPTITIPDPAAVGRWLDDELPDQDEIGHHPAFSALGWSVCHYQYGQYIYGKGDTPEALLADLQAKLSEHDPLAKLRKEAEAYGYGLIKLPQD